MIVNRGSFFLSHRLPIAYEARKLGYKFHVAAPQDQNSNEISQAGFPFHPISLRPKGYNPLQEFTSIADLLRLFRRLKPDLVHHVTIKPVLYGGIAARIANVPSVLSAISGLGHVFVSQTISASLLRFFVKLGYRFAFGHKNEKVIFQNKDDRETFIDQKLVSPENCVIIQGSGVNLRQFYFKPEPKSKPPVIVLASRMLWDKGVGEFVKAAETLLNENVSAHFILVGELDPGNPSAISSSQMKSLLKRDGIQWWGHQKNMFEIISNSHVICLPSYREGIPKVLLEAAACGRPIVTTNVPGCREVVQNGENGLIVPPKDSKTLAEALKKLVEDSELRRKMGAKSREIAVAKFSIEKVVRETISVYKELLPK
ncbi:glycosyltransferase family 4 protein [bacterium]|nr:glycosyltransferase family 4 protein [bacterium]